MNPAGVRTVDRAESGARRSRALLVVLGLAVTLTLGWFARGPLLVGAATLLVAEDPLSPADLIVVSNSLPRAAALEAALLYNQQISRRVVMAQWIEDPLDDQIRSLGVPFLGVTGLSKAILERSGVPASAITVLADPVDGTHAEVSTIAAFIEQCQPGRVLVITARNHTARTRWLLRSALSDSSRVAVRSSRFDAFSVNQWWRDRNQAREFVGEYLRWFNTALPDLWRPSPSTSNAIQCSRGTRNAQHPARKNPRSSRQSLP